MEDDIPTQHAPSDPGLPQYSYYAVDFPFGHQRWIIAAESSQHAGDQACLYYTQGSVGTMLIATSPSPPWGARPVFFPDLDLPDGRDSSGNLQEAWTSMREPYRHVYDAWSPRPPLRRRSGSVETLPIATPSLSQLAIGPVLITHTYDTCTYDTDGYVWPWQRSNPVIAGGVVAIRPGRGRCDTVDCAPDIVDVAIIQIDDVPFALLIGYSHALDPQPRTFFDALEIAL
jgi:hypothetical protein